ncbi:MAG TPA: beta galactosidase jelly roll domain-containing protein [Armatimonadota bacterium]|nr:beta galactosidase jelly roll domain-containing protein [Armatimonadota bacterium]
MKTTVTFLASLVCCVVLASAVALAAPAATDVSPAPTNSAELTARLQQLRDYYKPYLRSLPTPLNVRTQKDLSGTWRWKFEVEDFRGGAKPQAPDWYRADLDDADWEQTTVPEWRYDQSEPFGTHPTPPPHVTRPDSRIVWYRTTVAGAAPQGDQRVFLVFAGVHWEAQVWLNGTFLGSHTAYWEPFRFDVTPLLKEQNVLAVRVLSGPKLGEPVGGWSVLPFALAVQPRYVRDAAQSVVGQREMFGFASSCFASGIGILREVWLETTGPAIVTGVFARGDLRTGAGNIRVETDVAAAKTYSVAVQVLPENFQGQSYTATAPFDAQQGAGQLAFTVPMPNARLWQPTDPCLYRCRVTIRDGNTIVDARDVLFGYRSFRLLTAEEQRPDLPEGALLLNDQPMYLRGAGDSSALNAFWYWRQDDKLLDAVLMFKAANFNAVRSNEHVQFAEVRELMDRVGLLTEQDNGAQGPSGLAPMDVIAELGGRLAQECYNNPSVILLTTGFEVHFDPAQFVTAVLAVDPERVVKPISGNMLDWSYGLPPGYPTMAPELWNTVLDDFHTYLGWYARAAMPKLSVRYPPGRLVTVGEFGAEALDSYTAMQHYPAHLQPPPLSANALWGNSQVKRGDPTMTDGLRGQRPSTLGQYIAASQQYQADVLAEQATGFRLSPQRIGGYAVFHFVDGLPAQWAKSIVSFDLTPKRAYFAMAQVNQPVVPLFQLVDDGATLLVWVANDRTEAFPGSRITWSVEARGKIVLQGERQADVLALNATQVARVDLSPMVANTPVATITLALSDNNGRPVARYQREVYLTAWQAPATIEEQTPAKAFVPRLPDAGGDPAKVDWTKAAVLTGWREINGAPTPQQYAARIAHDGHSLYVKLEGPYIAAELQTDGAIWGGDHWQLVFAKERAAPYRRIGVNSQGAFQQLTSLKQPDGAALPLCGPNVVSDLAKDHWTVLVAMPLETLVIGGLKSGSVCYSDFFRHTGGGDVFRECFAWTPTFQTDVHVPEQFGELTLQ